MSETAALRAAGIVAGYGDREVLGGIDLELPRGQVTTVVGPNGCGKSTFVRVLSRLLRPTSGDVLLEGQSIGSFGGRELARRLAMLPQSPVAPEGMTVGELAARGRQPHQPWYRQWSREDEEIAGQAMEATGVADLADRPLEELSGGQRQRAWIAMALAQRTDLLLLDEPTSHLDLAHAVEVLDLVVALRRDAGKTVVLVLHDLSLAARYSDHLVVMDAGRVVATGAPAEVVTETMLSTVFGIDAHVFPDPVAGLPTVVPVGHA
ncbi:ABC transporter ATP-binding protein [Nocardioides sp. cx-169]|uniref:ABC transporter ATP-binding protein n=1 Tax=Nocardioides sp. cx-169 TaxID=2899080 RepID=UPI001E3045CE|nr:ABC transporter ATP-binding protein [Nocardioides sp. cx-169]MCD4532821.1 ABC transporter ATP-binding protein [Nocardioides sp. cx-169]